MHITSHACFSKKPNEYAMRLSICMSASIHMKPQAGFSNRLYECVMMMTICRCTSSLPKGNVSCLVQQGSRQMCNEDSMYGSTRVRSHACFRKESNECFFPAFLPMGISSLIKEVFTLHRRNRETAFCEGTSNH